MKTDQLFLPLTVKNTQNILWTKNTNQMVYIHSSATDGSLDSQQTSRILWNPKFIYVVKIACRDTESDYFSPSRSILFLQETPMPRSSKCHFFQVSSLNPCLYLFYALQVRPISQTHSPSFDHPKNIWWKINLIQVPNMQFFKTFYNLQHRLRVKYFPQHPILAHPPLYAPFQYDRPNVTPIYSHGPNYSSVRINLHVLSSKS
jgi:hypothetical protein